jgi:hypothetical protein
MKIKADSGGVARARGMVADASFHRPPRFAQGDLTFFLAREERKT